MRLRASALLLALLTASGGCGSEGSSAPGKVVTRVSIAALSSAANMQPGKTLQLTATATDATGTVILNPGALAWSSSATAVATVDQTGKVTGVAPGQTTIATQVSGIAGTFALTIVPPPPNVKDTIFTPGKAFSPNYLAVKSGTTVMFALGLDGLAHDVRFDAKAGAPAYIQPVAYAYVPVTMNVTGIFHYTCPSHPEMIGDIIVQ